MAVEVSVKIKEPSISLSRNLQKRLKSIMEICMSIAINEEIFMLMLDTWGKEEDPHTFIQPHLCSKFFQRNLI